MYSHCAVLPYPAVRGHHGGHPANLSRQAYGFCGRKATLQPTPKPVVIQACGCFAEWADHLSRHGHGLQSAASLPHLVLSRIGCPAASASVIQPLQTIQNFAARLVLLAPRYHHSTFLLDKLHWLPISERIKNKVACMCFSAINGFGPAYLSELLHVYAPSRTLRSSSDTRMLEIQQYERKTHGFRTFSCFGPYIWNSLPQDFRHCSTLSSFKAKLKTFLFSQYFHPN